MTQKTIKSIPALAATAAILATAFLSLNTTSVFAEESLWTLDDMVALSAEFEPELDEACAGSDDFMCKDMYIWQKSDPIYWALYGFQSSQLFITSFNPSSGALRIYYNDVDLNTKHMGSSTYQHDLADLYIVQYDKGYVDNYTDDLKNGVERDHRYTLLYKSEATDGAKWLPANTEVGFSALNFSNEKLSLNPKLYYTYKTTSGLSVGDIARLEGCVNSSDYQDGMECQIRFSSSGTPTYVPAVATAQEESATDTEAPSTDVADIGTSDTTDSTTGADTADTVSSTVVATASTTSLDSTTPATPNTGEATADQNHSIEFPWWLGAIFIAGPASLIWFFRPNHRKFPKKSSKKC